MRASLWESIQPLASILGQLGEPTIMPALVQALDEPHIRVQLGAIHVLGWMHGERVEQALLRVLQERSHPMPLRQEAVKALGRMKAISALSYLVRLARKERATDYYSEGDEVAQALKEMGTPALEALSQVLQDNDADFYERSFVASTLGHIWPDTAYTLFVAFHTLLPGTAEQALLHDAVIEAVEPLPDSSTRLALLDLLQRAEPGLCMIALQFLETHGASEEKVLHELLLDMDEEPDLRLLIAELLAAHSSEETITALLGVAYDEEEDDDLRQHIIELLGTIGNPAAVEDLTDLLDDDDERPHIRAAALFALAEIGDTSLLNRLTHFVETRSEEPGVRLAAVQVVGRMGRREAVSGLVEVIERADEDVEVYEAAIDALGTLGNEAAVQSLLQIALDSQAQYSRRLGAIGALGTLGNARAVPGLTSLLQTMPEKSFLQHMAVQALGAIGDARAIQPLLQLRNAVAPENVLRHVIEGVLPRLLVSNAYADFLALLQQEPQEIELQRDAVQALGELGDARAVEPLLQVLQQRKEAQLPDDLPVWQATLLRGEAVQLRQEAALALGKIGGTQAVEGLLAALTDTTEDQHVHNAAVQALGQIGSPTALEGLLQVFEQGDMRRESTTESTIIAWLATLGDARVAARLLRVLRESQHESTQHQAAQALQQIVERGNEPLKLADALLTCSEEVSNMQGTDEQAHRFTLTVICELLLCMRYQLRAAAGDAWPLWRKRLMPPTLVMRLLGKREKEK